MTFHRACALTDIPEDEGLAVDLEELTVVLARDGEDVYALQDLCSHAAVPLSEGEVADCQIECWLHGSMFDLRSGKPTNLPATEPVATFPVDLRDGDVYVDVDTTLNGVTPA
ncbi:Rieske (2Fe-2S) protein [Nocardioides sambongensis]|uniref:Rieske (2Fe-2S) protein n=1 Tax=Nocardioides sambongensis TaxID=2589074 RepID=UPI00112673B1|nr:non-heme iron oxygenase ferredoxin subunit [Nocardioides sambongensis]